jgi:hypothetical protein
MRHTGISKHVTCKVCGLTARNKEELADHIRHAHESSDSNKASTEQKVDPFH